MIKATWSGTSFPIEASAPVQTVDGKTNSLVYSLPFISKEVTIANFISYPFKVRDIAARVSGWVQGG